MAHCCFLGGEVAAPGAQSAPHDAVCLSLLEDMREAAVSGPRWRRRFSCDSGLLPSHRPAIFNRCAVARICKTCST